MRTFARFTRTFCGILVLSRGVSSPVISHISEFQPPGKTHICEGVRFCLNLLYNTSATEHPSPPIFSTFFFYKEPLFGPPPKCEKRVRLQNAKNEFRTPRNNPQPTSAVPCSKISATAVTTELAPLVPTLHHTRPWRTSTEHINICPLPRRNRPDHHTSCMCIPAIAGGIRKSRSFARLVTGGQASCDHSRWEFLLSWSGPRRECRPCCGRIWRPVRFAKTSLSAAPLGGRLRLPLSGAPLGRRLPLSGAPLGRRLPLSGAPLGRRRCPERPPARGTL